MPRIAVITDLHWPERIARNGFIRHGDKALSVVAEFRKAAANGKADLAVHLGDAVTSRGYGRDKFKLIHSRLNCLPKSIHIHHIPGNNEDECCERSYWSDTCGSPGISSSEDVDGVHLVFFRPSAKITKLKLPCISDDLD